MFRAQMKAGFGVAALLGVCASLPATAHHSVAGTYDMEGRVEISGTIAMVELRNPHLRIEVTNTTEPGESVRWLVEMAAPYALVQRGMSPGDVLVVGRQVTIEAWPAKDGTHRASAHTLVTADGATFDVTDTFGRFIVPDTQEFEVIDRWAPDSDQTR